MKASKALPKMGEEKWALTCTKSTNTTQVGRIANNLLIRFSKVAVDAMGAEGVTKAYSIMKWNHNRLKGFLKDLGFQFAFYVERREVIGAYDGQSVCLRFLARAIPFSEQVDLPLEEMMRAPKDDQAIYRSAAAMKNRILEKGFARVQGIGPRSVNRLIKASITANEYWEADKADESDESFLWIVPHDGLEVQEAEGTGTFTATCMDLVKGPRPMS